VERSLRLAIKNRLIASPPQSIIEKGLRTVYISPAQRANRIQEAEATMRALERIIALSQVYPEMLDNYDPDKIARTIHNDFAADPSILRTQRTVKEMRKQRQEEEEMAQQQEQMNQSMESSAPSGVTSIETAEALNQIRGAF